MSPLAKMIIQALENEDDDIVLAEVLDFYEYLKEKKKRQKDILWKNIQEDEPTNEEVEIINNYIQNDSNDTISSLLKTIVSPLCSTFKTLIFSTFIFIVSSPFYIYIILYNTTYFIDNKHLFYYL